METLTSGSQCLVPLFPVYFSPVYYVDLTQPDPVHHSVALMSTTWYADGWPYECV